MWVPTSAAGCCEVDWLGALAWCLLPPGKDGNPGSPAFSQAALRLDSAF